MQLALAFVFMNQDLPLSSSIVELNPFHDFWEAQVSAKQDFRVTASVHQLRQSYIPINQNLNHQLVYTLLYKFFRLFSNPEMILGKLYLRPEFA